MKLLIVLVASLCLVGVFARDPPSKGDSALKDDVTGEPEIEDDDDTDFPSEDDDDDFSPEDDGDLPPIDGDFAPRNPPSRPPRDGNPPPPPRRRPHPHPPRNHPKLCSCNCNCGKPRTCTSNNNTPARHWKPKPKIGEFPAAPAPFAPEAGSVLAAPISSPSANSSLPTGSPATVSLRKGAVSPHQ